MSLHRYAAKRDANEEELIADLAQCGWFCKKLSIPDWPDLLCMKGGRLILCEVKNPETYGKLKKGQDEAIRICAQFGIHVVVARDSTEFLKAVGDMEYVEGISKDRRHPSGA